MSETVKRFIKDDRSQSNVISFPQFRTDNYSIGIGYLFSTIGNRAKSLFNLSGHYLNNEASDAERYAVSNPERYSTELEKIKSNPQKEDLDRIRRLESQMESVGAELQMEPRYSMFRDLAKPFAWFAGLGIVSAGGAAVVAGYAKNCDEDNDVHVAAESGMGDAIEAWMNCITEDKQAAHTELDSDNDGLSDVNEREIGTDPFSPDTDNDNLGDNYEYVSSFLNPLHKDAIIEEYIEDGASALAQEMKDSIISYYANEVPVSNPDGKPGVNLHFVEGKEIDYSMPTVKAVYKKGPLDETSRASPGLNRITAMSSDDDSYDRFVFNHEISHLMFPNIPVTYQSNNDPDHTNINDDVLVNSGATLDNWKSSKVLWEWKESNGDKLFPRQDVLLN